MTLLGWLVPHFGPDWNISIIIGWIATKFGAEVHGHQRMNPTNFGDLLTFPEL